LQPYWQRLRSELERFGGTIEKFIGDAVMALFGAPVAHEDDPERAVRAALAIRDWAREEKDIQVRIAVQTGEALVLLDARAEEGEGMATGDVVNTAARLQSAAPTNGILVGETTWRATRDRIEYAEGEPVTAKGKAEPIAVWEPLNARARVGMDLEQETLTPLVGREGELGVLADALDRVRREREPQLVTLVGVPGIGKSRLVAELFQRIELDPELIWWRQGRALPYGGGVSFWALGEMVKAHAGIHENDAEEEAGVKLRASVEETVDEHESSWVLRHLEPLVGLGEDAALDRTEAFAGWRRYLEGLAEQRPLVLVFEDLHWADDGLLDFVDYVAEWATGVPLLVLGTARPELLDRRPGWGGGKLNATTVALSPLPDADAARVIAAVLDRALLPAEMQEALLERAGGNPLYAEQFARLFLERRSVDDLPLPENVQGIIAARLDALPPDEKRLLHDAAVLGKVFWSGGVASLTRLDSDSIASVLHALERKGFVRRERRSAVAGESEFAFRHVLVREVAYGQVPRPARADKHVLAAEWIESLGRAEDHAELLAHHYATALELAHATGGETKQLTERARLALRDAGDRAAALNSFKVASGFYKDALEFWPAGDPDQALLLLALARAEYHGGDTVAERLGAATDALLASGRPELAAEAEALAAEAAWHRGERDVLEARLARALELVEPLPDSRSKAWILSQASRYEMLAGRYAPAIDYGGRALELATALNLPEVRVHALNNVGSARARSGDPDGIRDLEASVALAREINSPEVARALNNLGSMHIYSGRVRLCYELELEAVGAAERFGLEALHRFARANTLGALHRLGLWEEALAGAEAFIAEETGAAYAEANAYEVRGLIRNDRGDLKGAKEDLAFSLEVGRRAGDPQAIFPALMFTVHVLVTAGEHESARMLALEFLTRRKQIDTLMPFLGPAEIVDGLAAVLGADEVVRVISESRRTPWGDAALFFVQGDFERALELYTEMEAAPDVALVHLRAAERLVDEGHRAEADAHLQSALEFYRSVRATGRIRQAEALLAAAG
jgi:tetratricopeptide (TPR) repeat protein